MPARRPAARLSGARPEALFQPPPERQPLAARMRPRTLDEFVGQEHLVGERGPLRRSIARGHLTSLLLWGPPGTGKTSLARLLAAEIGADFATLSAVMSGVAEVRAALAAAQERIALHGTRTILFIDEIHRFNKAQQDALLPHVEDGTVTLVGATTENPYFEVNSALLSRLRVWRLEPLTDDEVAVVVRRALADVEHGLAGGLGPGGGVSLADDAFAHLVSIAGGDARSALNVLEGAVALAESEGIRDAGGRVAPRLEDIEAAAQQRILAYDRAGDGHYDTASAFIKSLRGNDPDAAVYWLAAMIAAGEDPKFIARRLMISASEDVGNADPRALQVAVAAAQALDWIGLPEAQYALAQATTYIATAPKSNRAGGAYFAAAGDIDAKGALPVPLHLRNAANPRMKHHGIGVGYRYPHDFEGADIEQRYLPEELGERRYYLPNDQGYEATIGERMARRAAAREAAKEAGRTPRSRIPGPEIQGSGGAGIQRTREENRRRLAETEKRDAGG
ncbi:MAG TPA: replication-associated recombination protein A [Candidatus Sulfomarinibacteraceae bacterium]|nr:replication-associated recombination protein A [Candidatus Sulfomarinibacteraceae bacterium]